MSDHDTADRALVADLIREAEHYRKLDEYEVDDSCRRAAERMEDAAAALARRIAEGERLRPALTSLRNECRGMLGAFRLELIEATSLTNVRVLERKVADADAALVAEEPPR